MMPRRAGDKGDDAWVELREASPTTTEPVVAPDDNEERDDEEGEDNGEEEEEVVVVVVVVVKVGVGKVPGWTRPGGVGARAPAHELSTTHVASSARAQRSVPMHQRQAEAAAHALHSRSS